VVGVSAVLIVVDGTLSATVEDVKVVKIRVGD
jgi:hypothetical protein